MPRCEQVSVCPNANDELQLWLPLESRASLLVCLKVFNLDVLEKHTSLFIAVVAVLIYKSYSTVNHSKFKN